MWKDVGGTASRRRGGREAGSGHPHGKGSEGEGGRLDITASMPALLASDAQSSSVRFLSQRKAEMHSQWLVVRRPSRPNGC